MLLSEQLVGEARERRQRRMSRRERAVVSTSAACFLLLAIAVAAFLPSEREIDPVLMGALVAAYVVVSRVRFEFGNGYVVPEQLVYVPMLLLTPLPYVPLLVAGAAIIALVPDIVEGRWHRETFFGALSDSWCLVAPVGVLALLAPGEPQLALAEVYALAFLAQAAVDIAWSVLRGRLVDGLAPKETVMLMSGTLRMDAILSPLAFVGTLAAIEEPFALLSIAPLVWLLDVFSRDREARYAATLELQRAYRGTVMLLSDVVEFEDPYTAQHSRSIVDLVQVVAEEMGFSQDKRQELEFGALLHDVGKIAIPKEILNKPAALDPIEFELIKTHTIEGQFMLDRVGGFLGQIGEVVRSCHERWDGRGYPDGLAGEEIPLAARIVSCCDAYNAMTTDRVYRKALSKKEAMAELATNAGTQFDPAVVAVLTEVLQKEQPELAPVEGVRAVLAESTLIHRAGAIS
ncbi:MAG: HD-GYP domain-containing protein [Thermoleophilaceae bacterium]